MAKTNRKREISKDGTVRIISVHGGDWVLQRLVHMEDKGLHWLGGLAQSYEQAKVDATVELRETWA